MLGASTLYYLHMRMFPPLTNQNAERAENSYPNLPLTLESDWSLTQKFELCVRISLYTFIRTPQAMYNRQIPVLFAIFHMFLVYRLVQKGERVSCENSHV